MRLATVEPIGEKTMSKWTESSRPEGDTDGSGSEEDMSVEVISPPRHASPAACRPITCSVSAKRAANEMEPEDVDTLLASSPPRPRKIQRVAGTSSISHWSFSKISPTFCQDHPERPRYLHVLPPLTCRSGWTASRVSPLILTGIILSRRILGRIL